MFTIDLLKGQGIPIKRRPWGVAIAAMAFAVPIFAAIAMFGFYISNRIVISVKKQEISSYEKNIGALSQAVELQKLLEMEKNNINNCLSEVSSSIRERTQWSPILATVVENMPHSIVLTKLDAKQNSIKKKVPKKDDPSKMVDVAVPVNILKMSVSGIPHTKSDKAVKDFMDSLRFSALLAPKFEDIKVSQKTGTFEGKKAISYEIDYIFRP